MARSENQRSREPWRTDLKAHGNRKHRAMEREYLKKLDTGTRDPLSGFERDRIWDESPEPRVKEASDPWDWD